jgi:RNA polymerase sigma factor (sigma-70 family)
MEKFLRVAEEIAHQRSRTLPSLHHPIDDIVQDAYLGLMQGLSWMRDDHDEPFLRRMIRREIEAGIRRRNKDQHEGPKEGFHEWTFETDDMLIDDIKGLNDRQREILRLVLKEHSYREIADATGLALATVAGEMKDIRRIAAKEFGYED